MINENLIRELVDKYFSEYKEYNLIIFIVFALLVVLFNIIQNIILTNKIEKFKSELKKSELKFSVYNQLQTETLSKLFLQLTEFKEITSIISKAENKSPEFYQHFVKIWLDNFILTTRLFSKEKYILPKYIKKQYTEIHKNFKQLFEYIKNEKEYKSNFYSDEIGEVIFEGDYQNLFDLTEKIQKINRNDIFEKAINDIELVRNEIEKHFEKLEI
jgi:ABC-type multidrug transport system fused ATPase/permease subunit